jgi:eukaryotic-like serine/threonine-protein kinase
MIDENNNSSENSIDKAIADYMLRIDKGEHVDREQFIAQHPDIADLLRAHFADADDLERLIRSAADDPIESGAKAADPAPLQVIRYFGDYELLKEIGRGGMGIVYKARQLSLGRIVAVKMILSGRFASAGDVERFHREAKAAANLKHPGIVAIHEIGEHDGRHYFSMDFIEGRSLAEIVRDSPLPSRQAAEYIRKVADAVGYAHKCDTLHRDIKPSNILIDSNENTHLTDFGLAKRVGTDADLTLSHAVVGTASYMAPEQASGGREEIGPAIDIYSLGATLYDLLTGRPPFRAETPAATLLQVQQSEPALPRILNSAVDRDLETICLKCLEKEPGRRYASVDALSEDLGRYLRGEPIQARPVGPIGRLWRWSKRQPLVAGLIAIALVLLLGGIAVSTYFAQDARNKAKEAEVNAIQAEENFNRAKANAIEAEENAKRAKTNAEQADENAKKAKGNAERAEANAVQANDARDREEKQRLAAEHQSYLANALRLAARSREVLDEYPQRSLLLAIESVETMRRCGEPRPPAVMQATEQALRDVFAAVNSKQQLPIGDGWISWMSISLRDRWLLARSVALDGVSGKGTRLQIQISDMMPDNRAAMPMVLGGHNDMIEYAATVADGSRAITVSRDRTARIWKLTANPAVVAAVVLDDYTPREDYFSVVMAISPDGRWLAANNMDKSIRVWDLATKGRVSVPIVFEASKQKFRCMAISPDSRRLAAGGSDGLVRLWNLTAKDPAAAPILLEGHKKNYTTGYISFSPDGRRLVTASWDKTVRTWDLTTNTPTSTAVTLLGEVDDFSWSTITPDGRWLATAGSKDKTVRVWDLSAKETSATPLIIRGQAYPINCLAFSPDGRWLATASRGILRLWDVSTKDSAAKPILSGVEKRDDAVSWASFSPDSRWFATGGEGLVNVYDLKGNITNGPSIVLRGYEGGAYCLSFSPDSRRLVTTSWRDKTARVWDLSAFTPHVQRINAEEINTVDCMSISPDQHWLVVGGVDGIYWLRDLTTKNPNAAAIVLHEDKNKMHLPCLLFNKDGSRLVTATDMRTRLWDLTAKDPAKSSISLPGTLDSIMCLAFSQDGRWVATGGTRSSSSQEAGGNQILLWDLRAAHSGAKPIVLREENTVMDCDFSPDGRHFVIMYSNHTFQIRDLSAADPTATSTLVSGCRGQSYWMAFSPDGRWMVTGNDEENTVRAWDLSAKDPSTASFALQGHDRKISSMAFSPDGHWLVTGSVDMTARIWDLKTDDPSAASIVLRGHENVLQQMAISQDSRWLVTADSRGATRMWNLTLDGLVNTARRCAGRELTAEERKQYMLEKEQ